MVKKIKKQRNETQSDLKRHKKVIKYMIENDCCVKKAMLKKGYSKGYSHNPNKLMKTKQFKKATEGIVKQLKTERIRAINRLKATINKAKYRDLNDGIDKLTKNIQLLQGKHTAIEKIDISDTQYNEILKREQERTQGTQTSQAPKP